MFLDALMKVAILYPCRTPGGTEEYLTHLIRALRELKHEVTLYVAGKTRLLLHVGCDSPDY